MVSKTWCDCRAVLDKHAWDNDTWAQRIHFLRTASERIKCSVASSAARGMMSVDKVFLSGQFSWMCVYRKRAFTILAASQGLRNISCCQNLTVCFLVSASSSSNTRYCCLVVLMYIVLELKFVWVYWKLEALLVLCPPPVTYSRARNTCEFPVDEMVHLCCSSSFVGFPLPPFYVVAFA